MYCPSSSLGCQLGEHGNYGDDHPRLQCIIVQGRRCKTAKQLMNLSSLASFFLWLWCWAGEPSRVSKICYLCLCYIILACESKNMFKRNCILSTTSKKGFSQLQSDTDTYYLSKALKTIKTRMPSFRLDHSKIITPFSFLSLKCTPKKCYNFLVWQFFTPHW